ncbi:MAG TPA: MoaD/ThiS family protein [Planctomycetota bacterium]|nr:MoaD/ThiS family protein [Planctomycetota bacterium]
MKVTVKYAAQARVATGLASEEVELDEPTTIHDLVIRLARQHGSAFRRLALDANGCPHPSLLVAIGDDQVRSGDHRKVASGETVTIITPISGG